MDKRTFPISISVKANDARSVFEASPAQLYGGPEGMYRVRVNRRWHDGPDGGPLFFDVPRLLRFIQSGMLEDQPVTPSAPVCPVFARVSVRLSRHNMPYYVCGHVAAPPVRVYDGRWLVPVAIAGERTDYYTPDRVILHPARRQ